MLVLTRKKDQSIVIGDNIEIAVLEIQGDQVRIGVKAPKNVAVHRKEIYLEIQEENRRAAEIQNNLSTDVLKQALMLGKRQGENTRREAKTRINKDK